MPLALARCLRSSHRRALLGGTALIGMAASLMGLADPARAQSAGAQTGGASNNIRMDGQTDTRLVVSGNKTDVFTNTIKSGNAFNSFSAFGVAQGNVVNLMVPDQAARLVNIVRDGPVNVQGVLNSYQNGVIGGRVVFADSYGMIVGASGVVNVGSLMIATPTKDVLDQMISGGVVNEALVGRVLRGDTPISPDGSVVIKGRIHARDEVAITAMDVQVAGSLEGARKAAEQRAAFTATVNAEGWTGNGAIVSRHGKISIAAVGDVAVDGSLKAGSAKAAGDVSVAAGGTLAMGASARVRASAGRDGGGKVALSGDRVSIAGAIKAQGAAGVKGGRVDIASRQTIEIAPTALVSVSGVGAQSDAGSIAVKAGTDLAVASGAQLVAAGGTSGDGGFVELSAQQTERLGAISVDLGAAQGRAGTLLLDPRDLVITGGAASANGASLSPNLLTNGGAVRLEADNSITVASDGLIDTRAQSGSGAITLIAPHLSVLAGGRLLASSLNGGGAGDVTLTATATATSDGASIAIGEAGAGKAVATLEGGRITLTATSEMLSVAHATIVIQNAVVTASGALTASAAATGEMSMTTTPLTVAVMDVLASVDALSGAIINAGSVDLSATGAATSNADAGMPKAFSATADAAAAIATTTSEARVRVAGDASVTSSGAVSLTAKNTVSSTATADATKGGADASGASVAVNVLSATTQALIEEQASVAADSLALNATADVSATTTAKAAAKGAEKPQEDSQASQYLNTKKSADGSSYADQAKTSEGKVSVAAALAIVDFDSVTTARMASSNGSTVTHGVSLASSAKNASTVLADGQTATGATGVGVGVALNIAKTSTMAEVNQTLQAGSLSITALSAGAASDNLFSASAVSGAGGDGANIGVAGALGLNVLNLENAARIGSGAAIALDGGDLEVKALNLATARVSAKPAGEGVSAEKLGVGASVALNVATTKTSALVGDGASINDAGAVTVDAGATINTETEAKAGAKGGTAVDAVVAISTLSQTTTARIGSGGLLTAAGNVSVSADSQGENTATAESETSHTNSSGQSSGQGSSGSGSGSGVAVGASIALITGSGSDTKTADEAAGGKIDGSPVRTSTTTAELARDVSTPGSLKVTATQEHSYVAKSSATAGGASDDANDKSASQNTLKSDAAQKAMDKNQTALNENQGPDKGSQTPEKGGKLSVAAALGGVIVSDVVVANVVSALSDPRALTANSLLVSATAKTKIQTLGNGSTTGEDNTGIGVGAALSLVLNDTTASIGDYAMVRSPGEVTVRAISSINEGLGGLAAVAASGASGKNLSVAGALALALSDSRTRARIGNNFRVVGRRSDDDSQDLAAGDVTITTSNTSQLAAKAWAGAYASGGTGIGASLVGVISLDQYAASLGDNASIKAANLTISATNVKVDDIFASLAPLLAAGEAKLDDLNALISEARGATGSLSDAARSETDKTKTAPATEGDTKADGVSSARDKLTKALKELAETARDLPLLGANNYYTEALAAYGDATIAVDNVGSTYGAAGVLSGTANATLANQNFVTIGAEARIEATKYVLPQDYDHRPEHGTVSIYAGRGLDGTPGALDVSATASLFNDTAIPISGAPDVQANVTSNGVVIIDTSTPRPGQRVGVTSAGDITVAADKGAVNALAHGEGTNIYLEGLEKVGTAISQFFGGGEVSLKLTSGTVTTGGSTLLSIDGNVEAGIQRTQTLVVTYGETSGYKFTGEIAPQLSGPYGQGATILKRLQDLQALKDQYAQDPIAVGAYQAEIVFLQNKLAAMGLATFDSKGAFQLNPGVTLGEAGTGPDQLLTTGLTNFAQDVNPDLYSQVETYANKAVASWLTGGDGVNAIRTELSFRYSENVTAGAVLAVTNPTLASPYQAAAQKLNGVIQSGDTVASNVSTTLATLKSAAQALTQTVADLSQVLKGNVGVNPKPPALNQALDGFFQSVIDGRNAVYQNSQNVKTAVDQYISFLTTTKVDVPDLATSLTSAINFASLMTYGGTTAPDGNGQSVGVIGLQNTALDYGFRTGWLAGTSTPPSGVTVTSLAQWRSALVDAMNGKAAVFPGTGADASYHVIAPTVVAYMSNIYLTGQKVYSPKGTGRLAAPGDAVISIQNYTDATLELNDIVIPNFDAGKVRVNDVEVNSNADITKVTGFAANFADANIVTAAKTGAHSISIESYYTPSA